VNFTTSVKKNEGADHLQNIGITEILIIVAFALLLFGAGSLPKLGRSIGEGIREFKKALSGKDAEEKKDNDSVEKK